MLRFFGQAAQTAAKDTAVALGSTAVATAGLVAIDRTAAAVERQVGITAAPKNSEQPSKQPRTQATR